MISVDLVQRHCLFSSYQREPLPMQLPMKKGPVMIVKWPFRCFTILQIVHLGVTQQVPKTVPITFFSVFFLLLFLLLFPTCNTYFDYEPSPGYTINLKIHTSHIHQFSAEIELRLFSLTETAEPHPVPQDTFIDNSCFPSLM